MGISRKVLMEYAEKPEFSAVIDMLIDAGLLAGGWTADDLLRALERLELRFEIVSLFGAEPANDKFDEAAYQEYLARGRQRASRAATKRKWRQNPENGGREKKSDKRRLKKCTRARRLKREQAHRAFQNDQRNDVKAKLKSRIAPLHKAERRRVPTVGWRWVESANQSIA